jgi:hypothetical protein
MDVGYDAGGAAQCRCNACACMLAHDSCLYCGIARMKDARWIRAADKDRSMGLRRLALPRSKAFSHAIRHPIFRSVPLSGIADKGCPVAPPAGNRLRDTPHRGTV